MNELIEVIEQDGQQRINARWLHEASGVKSRFNDWINNHIKTHGFVEGEDFFFTTRESTGTSGRPQDEYSLTMPAAVVVVADSNSKGKFKLLKWLMRTVEASNAPDMVIERAAQITRDSAKHYGTALGNLTNLTEKLFKDKKYASVIGPIRSAVYDLATIIGSVVLNNDAAQRKLGALMQYYGLDREQLDDLFFGMREKMSDKAFWALGDKYEGSNRKQLPA